MKAGLRIAKVLEKKFVSKVSLNYNIELTNDNAPNPFIRFLITADFLFSKQGVILATTTIFISKMCKA